MTVSLRCFAAAGDVAGRRVDRFDLEGATLGRLLEEACVRYGEEFRAVLDSSRVWVDGDEPPEGLATVLGSGTEVAVLPPVSGG